MNKKNKDNFKLLESFIDAYLSDHGRSPSNREISEGTGLSTATVSRYLSYMREHGMLDYEGQRNIITRRHGMHMNEFVEVPILGNVACGLPKYAEENIEAYVRLPVSLFGKGKFFLLRAKGESMKEIGIMDQDLILIRKQDSADPGQIVVALVDDEATLKRYYPEPEYNRVRLHPENSGMEDIYVTNCMIQGVAVKVMKDIE